MNHLMLKVELDSNFVCLTLFIYLHELKFDLLGAEDHKVMEDLEELFKVSPFCWSSFFQELDHLYHESDANGLRDLVSLIHLLSLFVFDFACNGYHLSGESDLFLLYLELTQGVLDNASQVLLRNFICTI